MVDHSAINPATFEQLKATLQGDTAFLDDLLADYLEDANEQLRRMRQALADDDVTCLKRTAHSLKSTSATVGAEPLADVCATIEQRAHAENAAAAAALVDEAARHFAATHTALQHRRESLKASH